MIEHKIPIPEGHEIDIHSSSLSAGSIIFKKIEKEYPLDVSKTDHDRYYGMFGSGVRLSSSDRVSAFAALMELVELRDAWNEIDGGKTFKVDQARSYFYNGNFEIKKSGGYANYVFQFHLESTRDLFMKTFKDLIETAKELI
jgi:hypothetical protein